MKNLITQFSLVIIAFVALSLLMSYTRPAATENKPKYATVNVAIRGVSAKIFVVMDGKVESIKCESGYIDQDAGQLAVFGPLQTQLEKLGESGYKLQSTVAAAPTLITYNLVKE